VTNFEKKIQTRICTCYTVNTFIDCDSSGLKIVNVVLWHVHRIHLFKSTSELFLYLVETLLIYTCISRSLIHLYQWTLSHFLIVYILISVHYLLHWKHSINLLELLFKVLEHVWLLSPPCLDLHAKIMKTITYIYIYSIYIYIHYSLIEKNALEIHWIKTSVIWFLLSLI